MLADRLADARFVMLDGVAHVPHLEGHRQTLDLIESFIAEMPR
jgi:hypothetical protein